jgi:hypothetical protein
MAPQRPDHGSDPQREERLLERLRAHPELLARFESILGLTDVAEGRLRTADEIEEQLVQEVRGLGHEVMADWAVRAEERVAEEVIQANAEVRLRKKKP